MERREFIKKTCLTCATVMGAGSVLSMLNSCAPLPFIAANTNDALISIPENSFKENQNLLIVKNNKLDYDILLIKKKDGTFNSFYMQCTHENQPLTATKTGLFCASHGSAFDLEGNVTVQPATKKLKQFVTSIQNQQITIQTNKLITN